MTLLRYAAVLTGSVIAGVVIAGGGAYLYLMGYTPLFEERLHHF